MNNTTILILYPAEFKCFAKFERKVSSIVSRLDVFGVVYLSDPNCFIASLFSKDLRAEAPELLPGLTCKRFTHAIVFDDGSVFPEERAWLRSNGIIMREIKTPITRVINIKKDTRFEGQTHTSEYEYIGRGSYWGNPYSMHEEGECRDEVIRKYKYDFDFDKFPNKEKSAVFSLAGKTLGCFCKPLACHGDVLADFLNAWDDGA